MSSLLWRTVLRRRGALAAALALVLVTAGTALAAARGDAWRLGYLETLSGYVTGISGAHTAELLAIVNSSTAAAARAIRAEGLSPTAGTLYVRNSGGGPAANFVANSGTAPFTVNRTTKITNLNADQLDGLDSSALQRRVTGSCAAGSMVTAVNADGTVVCEADDDTTYTGAHPIEVSGGTIGLSSERCEDGFVYKYAAGGWTCEPDAIDGGDAATVDGIDSTEFARTANGRLEALTGQFPTDSIAIAGLASIRLICTESEGAIAVVSNVTQQDLHIASVEWRETGGVDITFTLAVGGIFNSTPDIQMGLLDLIGFTPSGDFEHAVVAYWPHTGASSCALEVEGHY